MTEPRRILARIWAAAGLLLGAVAVAAGVALAAVSVELGDSIAQASGRAAEGLEGAEHLVSVLSEDLGTSGSILSQVSSTVRLTGDVVDDTREVLGGTSLAVEDLVAASRSAATAIDVVSGRFALVIPGGTFEPVSEGLEAAAQAGDAALASADSLSMRLTDVSLVIDSVAAAVDSLRSDLAGTRTAMEEAAVEIESLRAMASGIRGEGLPATAGVIAGALLVFLGLQEIFFATGLAWLNPGRGARRDG